MNKLVHLNNIDANTQRLNEMIDNVYSMNKTEINDSITYLMKITNHQLARSVEDTRRAIEASEYYQSEMLDLMKQVEDYEDFIRDSLLEKRFLFHLQKGVI